MAIALRNVIKISRSLAGLRRLKIPDCLTFCLQNEFIRKRRTQAYYFSTPGIHEQSWVSESPALFWLSP